MSRSCGEGKFKKDFSIKNLLPSLLMFEQKPSKGGTVKTSAKTEERSECIKYANQERYYHQMQPAGSS